MTAGHAAVQPPTSPTGLRMPDWTFTGPLLGRSALIWASARACLAFVNWAVAGFAGPFSLAVTAKAAIWTAAVVGVLGVLELRRRNEHLLLANLGIPQRTLAALATVPAILGELALASMGTDAAPRG